VFSFRQPFAVEFFIEQPRRQGAKQRRKDTPTGTPSVLFAVPLSESDGNQLFRGHERCSPKVLPPEAAAVVDQSWMK
jgi:hypothetical protein